MSWINGGIGRRDMGGENCIDRMACIPAKPRSRGRESAELKTIGTLGKDKGVGAKASAPIEQEPATFERRHGEYVAFQAAQGLRRVRLDVEVAQGEAKGRAPRPRDRNDGQNQITWRQ